MRDRFFTAIYLGAISVATLGWIWLIVSGVVWAFD
jgi:hypothetical protein